MMTRHGKNDIAAREHPYGASEILWRRRREREREREGGREGEGEGERLFNVLVVADGRLA